MFYKAANLEQPRITHGFFGRQGGTSTGVFSSLNCLDGCGDDDRSVKANRRRIVAALDMPHNSLLSVRQDHTSHCVTVTEPWAQPPVADAMVTKVPGLALGILTADCAPVLFLGHDEAERPVIGAAHAGWRGAVGGVVDATINAMREFGAQNIRAAIGPCIAQKSYEVMPDFLSLFLDQDEHNRMFFEENEDASRFYFNLPLYVESRLHAAGVKDVHCTGHDTYELADDFFSYRRSSHEGHALSGRQMSVIAIRGEGE